VLMFWLEGEIIREIELPGRGAAAGFSAERGDRETFYSYESFDTPETLYHYDFETDTSRVFRQPTVGFEPDDYVVEQVFYQSRDGTRIPMFITHRKDLTLDGARPTLLYGYGGFDISLAPSFSMLRMAWMEMGGVFASANLRGGGEFGRDWHEAGKRDQAANNGDQPETYGREDKRQRPEHDGQGPELTNREDETTPTVEDPSRLPQHEGKAGYPCDSWDQGQLDARPLASEDAPQQDRNKGG